MNNQRYIVCDIFLPLPPCRSEVSSMSTNAYVPCELRDEEYHNSYCVLQEGEQCRKGERTREKSRDI